jgi:hypothetical protein
MSALGQKWTFQHALQVGFDALKMYRVAAEKYFPASLNCSNAPCHA